MTTHVTRRRLLTTLAAAPVAFASRAFAGQNGEAGGARPDPRLISDLVAGNHILVRKGVIVVHGHLSARHDRDPNRFFMTRGIAPELVTVRDVMEFDLDGKPMDTSVGQPYLERFIHSEIYRARPDVMAVVHAHTPSVLPFATSDIPLRAVYQQTTFLGDDPAPVYRQGENGDLIRNPEQGRALAKALGNRAVILLHGHGEVVVGFSIPSVVGRCIELDTNARMLTAILSMGGKPAYLDPPADAAASRDNFDRGWDAWLREETAKR